MRRDADTSTSRRHMQRGGWPNGAGPSAAPWGHASPAPGRNPWHDPNQMGPAPDGMMPLQPGMPPANGEDFVNKIWMETQMEAPPAFMAPMQHANSKPPAGIRIVTDMETRFAVPNGMVEGMPPNEFMRPPESWEMPPGQPPIKQDNGMWKGPQHPAGPWIPPNGQRWNPHMPPMQQPPPMNGIPGGWPPNGMIGIPPQGMAPGGWNPVPNQRQPMGGPQSGHGGRRYTDVSIPPPMDQYNMGMRGGPPHNPPQMWKDPNMGIQPAQFGQENMLNYPEMGVYGNPPQRGNGGGPGVMTFAQPQQSPSEDLMWRDPNFEMRKWQRDTGVSVWGDPDKAAQRPVKLWTVDEGAEEDYEVAIQKCPIPKKPDNDSPRTNVNLMMTKRQIVITGWGDLPDNDPNKSTVTDDQTWAKENLGAEHNWSIGAQQRWREGHNPAGPAFIEGIAEKMRLAVEKGFLDPSVTALKQLPPGLVAPVNNLLEKLPDLEMVEKEMADLVEMSKPEGAELVSNSPKHFMSEVQKMEYDRLVIQLTTLRIELGELAKKIRRQLSESGMASVDSQFREEPYYPFLDKNH